MNSIAQIEDRSGELDAPPLLCLKFCLRARSSVALVPRVILLLLLKVDDYQHSAVNAKKRYLATIIFLSSFRFQEYLGIARTGHPGTQ